MGCPPFALSTKIVVNMAAHTFNRQQQRGKYGTVKNCPINKLPDELVDMIMENFATDNPRDEDESNHALHSCSLTQRRWRRSAQRIYHSTVYIDRDNSNDIYRHYGPACEPHAAQLGLYPRKLYVDAFEAEDVRAHEYLYGFASRCGEHITVLDLDDVAFASFNDFLKLFKHFPRLINLSLTDCYWDGVDMGPWHDCEGVSACPCAAPGAPVSLQHVYVGPREGTNPVPLARWLMHTREEIIPDLACTFRFSVQNTSSIRTSETLRILGPSLGGVTLDVEVDGQWSNDHQQLGFPDLSLNTRLYSLQIQNVVPGCCPANYLASIILKMNSPTLNNIIFQFVFDDSSSLQDADYFDYTPFDQLLSDCSRFPQLREVTFLAIQGGQDVEERLFLSYILPKLPLLNASKDIEVGVRRSLPRLVQHEQGAEDDIAEEEGEAAEL
ncbi:hypothetical protein BC629DRAFT_236004 [Irpex lacteus]|nr:hypothetical protein BC629DRAFT_236004 [Irpex lacteus]